MKKALCFVPLLFFSMLYNDFYLQCLFFNRQRSTSISTGMHPTAVLNLVHNLNWASPEAKAASYFQCKVALTAFRYQKDMMTDEIVERARMLVKTTPDMEVFF